MFSPGNITSKTALYVISSLSIVLVSIVDWVTGVEISFSVFYLFPICFFALYKTVDRTQLLVNAGTATILWFLADTSATSYSHPAIPYWNAFVRLVYFVSISQLIYSLRKTNDSLGEANEHLRKLNDEKNKFIGIAAHDLRNPIGAINSYSKILMSSADKSLKNSDRREIYSFIHNTSKYSLHIVENVLDISSIESGKIDLHFQEQEYLETVKQSIHLNNFIAGKKQITIKLKTKIKKLAVEFDKHYIAEALDNLLTNAIKYSHPKSNVTVTVSTENDYVITEITDTGVGIPEEEIGRLFSPFQKASSKPTQGESSTGLGLAIVKNIITRHHGEITVRSGIARGSTFSFRLPLKQLFPR